MMSVNYYINVFFYCEDFTIYTVLVLLILPGHALAYCPVFPTAATSSIVGCCFRSNVADHSPKPAKDNRFGVPLPHQQSKSYTSPSINNNYIFQTSILNTLFLFEHYFSIYITFLII